MSSCFTDSLNASTLSAAWASDNEDVENFVVRSEQRSAYDTSDVLRTPRHRLSFSGFQSIEQIVSIEQVDDVCSDGRRRSMVVKMRGVMGGENGSVKKALWQDSDKYSKPNSNRRPLAQVTNVMHGAGSPPHYSITPSSAGSGSIDDNPAVDTNESVESSQLDIRLMTPRPDNMELDCEVMVEDKELVQFCSVVLQLLRRELETSSDIQGGHYNHLETLPKLREAFNNLITCTEVPTWLSQKAREMKTDLESQLRAKGVKTKVLETLKEEHDMEKEQAILQAKAEAEAKWKRKVSMSKKEALEQREKQVTAERAGMVNFVKQCVRAIAILKEKIEGDKETMKRIHQEKLEAALKAKEQAREEAEVEWSRRLSMVRRETEKKTKDQVEREFKKSHDEAVKAAIARARAEAEKDWSVRLHEEQRNRRLSAQLKLTAAVERASKRAELDKEAALSALAEELEKEKEDASRTAAEIARNNTEAAWKRKLSMGIRDAKEELMKKFQQKKQEVDNKNGGPDIANMSSSSSSSEKPLVVASTGKAGGQHVSRHTAPPGFQLQREEHVWIGNTQEVRRFSLVEGAASATSTSMTGALTPRNSGGGLVPQQNGHARQLFRGLSQDFDTGMMGNMGRCSSGSSGLPSGGAAFDSQKRVSFFLQNGVRNGNPDFSRDYALPSPIAIVPMPLDDTMSTNIMTPGPSAKKLGEKGLKTTDSTTSAKKRLPMAMVDNGDGDFTAPFKILDLVVKPGDLKGSLSSKYREYHVSVLVLLDNKTELRTRKILRYSAAREAFHDKLYAHAYELGLHFSYQPVFSSFPPKSVVGSNSEHTSVLRAKAIQNYLLSVYDVSTRLLRITKDEKGKKDIRALLDTVFSDFTN